MFRVTSRLRFIELQLPSLVDQPPEGKHWIHEIKHDGYRCQVLDERGESVSSPATDTIGATAIPLSSVQPPSSIADRRFWMEKLLSKTATVLLTSRH